MKKLILFLLIFLIEVSNVLAQCPMCKQNVQAGLESGGKVGLGLNSGIIYLLAIPYLIAAAFGYWYWKNRNKM
jgi:hypothetical protein